MKTKCLPALMVTVLLLSSCAGDGRETLLPSPGPAMWTTGEAFAPSPVPPAQATEGVIVTFACPEHRQGSFTSLAEDFTKANSDVRVQIITTDEPAVENLAAAADTFISYVWSYPEGWTFLLDLGPFLDDPSFPTDDFYPGTLDRFRWQGRIYGLPAEINPILIFYDRQVFDEAGLPYPHIGWTWDDFMEVATRLTERAGDEVRRYGFVDAHPFRTILTMVQAHAVPLWDERADPAQPLFDTPEVAEIVRRYVDMALRYEIMPVPEIGSNVTASSLVNAGKAAMWTDFAFDRDYHSQRTELGLAPFPEGVEADNPRSMYGFFISASTAQPEAAWRWLNYLSANYQPFLSDTLPGRQSVAQRLPWWTQLDEEARSVYDYALAHPPTNDSSLNTPLLIALADVFERDVGVEEALAKAQDYALRMQAALAESAQPTPKPVASPPPGPGEGQTVITFAPALSTDAPLYRELAALFQESHPDVQINVVVPPLDVLMDLGRLTKANDCFAQIGATPADTPEARQHVRALGPLRDADASFDLADYYSQFLQPLQDEGELWGLPYEAEAVMVYLNLDRFAEAGVTPPAPGWTIDEFMNAAVALGEGDQYGFTTYEGAYGNLIFVLERMGAHLYDGTHDPPTPTLDDPTVVAAMSRYADLSRGRKLSLETPSRGSGWPDSWVMGGHPLGVETGEVGMWVDTTMHYSVAPPLSFETGVLPLPVGTTASSEFMIRAYYISAYTSEPQVCWEWLTFISDLPETVQMLPARRSIASSAAWQGKVGDAALPAYQATLEYQDTLIFYLRWKVPWLGYAYPWIDGAFQAIVEGEDAGRALAEAQARAEDLLACLEAAGTFSDHAQLLTCAQEVDPDYPLR